MNPNVLKAIAVTAELTGTELSEMAVRVMESDLSAYPESSALRALDACRKELKGRLTLAAVLERIEEEDGRPNSDEAWAIAVASADESETVVWTEETAKAYGVALPLLETRDKVGARMAFKDAYERLVRDARAAAAPCSWSVSIGYDLERRAVALQAAINQKRISAAAVSSHLLPALGGSPIVLALLADKPQALLEQKDLTQSERETNLRGLAGLKAHLEQIERESNERAARWAAEEVARAGDFAKRKALMLEQVEAAVKGREGAGNA